MNLINIILTVLLVIALLSACWMNAMLQKNKNFKRFVKEGDIVDFYIAEERHAFKLTKMEEDFSEITGKDGYIIEVPTSELLPNLMESYPPIDKN